MNVTPATRHQHHFEDLSPDDFERLVYWLVKRSGGFEQVQWYGGARDKGRDVVAYKHAPAGREKWYIQCKRYQSITFATLRDELDKLAEHTAAEPDFAPDVVVFAIACSISPQAKDQATEYAQELNLPEPYYWGRLELDERLKTQPKTEEEFFDRQLPDNGIPGLTAKRSLLVGLIFAFVSCIAAIAAVVLVPEVRQALGLESPTPTIAPTPSPPPTNTPMLTSIPTQAPTSTSTPTEPPVPTFTPSCPAVTGPFAAVWNSIRGEVGCVIGGVTKDLIAEENFDGGKMFWREPIDYAQALVLFNDGTWKIFEHSLYVEDSPEFSCTDANTPARCPPTPKRGFGMMWCDILEIRSRLGNATDCERSYQGSMQQFERGFVFQSDNGVIYVLYDDGRWERWGRSRDEMAAVYVPAGEFQMGSETGESDERPVHLVHLNGFWIGQFEVTNADFEQFVLETDYQTIAEKVGWGYVWQNGWHRVDGLNWRHPSHPSEGVSAIVDHPVVQVSWQDANAYCQWAGGRLPTEAEWEMAAVGTTGWKYPWGNEFDPTRLNASGNGTTRAGSYPIGKSPWGSYDMAGNVWEWVSDWYQDDYYAVSPGTNPQGPTETNRRTLRGGGWDPSGGDSRSTDRGALASDRQGNTIGFRCAWDL